MENILIFNAGYTPAKTYGGPVVSISNLVKSLHDKFNFSIITNSTEINSDENIDGIDVNLVNSGEYSEEILFLDKDHYNVNYIEESLFKNNFFDLIYINSFFNFNQLKIAIYFSKKYNIPMLVAPRGELEENALKIKRHKKLIYLQLLKFIVNNKKIYFQATSNQELKNINKLLKIPIERIIKLENIPTTINKKDFSLHKKKEINKLNICFISRIQTKKNLDFSLKILKSLDSKYEVKFDIYGPIENKQYWEKCSEIIESLPKNVIVNYGGIVSHDDIVNTFSNYDLFLFPTKSENFGHVIFEALTAQIPVILSDQTPWNDINGSGAGSAISLDKPEIFLKEIENFAAKDENTYNNIRKNIEIFMKNKIDVDNILKQYLTSFEIITTQN
ncbi:glycosyltransferase [Aerococcus urinaeequi]|uniref:glycosyltransferase n=1 Tax=Aerococcus urinaeequi TaxID=51665 RepID=UPI003D6AE52E